MPANSKTLLTFLCSLGAICCFVFLFTHRENPESLESGDGKNFSTVLAETAGTGKSPDQAGQISHSPRGHPARESSPDPIDVSRVEPFRAFQSWINEYRDLPAADRPEVIDRGLALAETRRPLIRQLIHENPEVALAHALTLDQYHDLPEKIRVLVERPFTAHAEIDVFPRCDGASAALQSDLNTSQDIDVHLTFLSDESKHGTLDAFVYGWRLETPSRTSTPVQGIHLDGLAAVREPVFQPLLDSEIPVAENLFPIANPNPEFGFATGRPLPDKPVVALAGGRLFYFTDQPAFEEFQIRAAALERKLGEANGAQLIFEDLAATIAGPGDDPDGFDWAAAEAKAGKIENAKIAGNRKVLMIRVDFSDKTGSPIGAFTLQTRMDGDVNDQCRDMSFGKLDLTTTVESPLVRMPRPSSYYNGADDGSKKNGTLYNDALAAAAAAGINTSGYNHRCIMFKNIGMGYCGLATVGGGKIWLPCYSSKVIVHELGHNFGISHASFHDPDDDNDPLGAGSTSEYGDNTDIMGGGGVPSGHFHPQFKTKLAWLDSGQRHNFNSGNTSNTYRIYRYDHPGTAAANSKRTVRVYRGTNNEYLWIGYRQRYSGTTYQNYIKGAQVHWQKAGKSKSWLVDLTPGGGKNNSGIGLGRTFSDTRKDIHITALKRGGSSPNQWLEVQVTRGPFAGNGAPAISLINLPARVPVNEAIVVTANATDPDSDPLVYDFDFKDGLVNGNDGTAATRNYTWTSKGSKTVTVTVSDRKGLIAARNTTVTVQDRLNPPGNFSASDAGSTFFDRIQLTWNSVPGGTSYVVYRSLSNSVATARPIVTTSSTSHGDTGAESETPYYYWVQALGSGAASNLSTSDAGYRLFNPPDPPVNLTATQGVMTTQINLTWESAETSSLFKIYRGTTSAPAQATLIAQTTSTQFSDTQADPGIGHHYWIRTENSNGLSEFSTAVTGSLRLHRPADVDASDGADHRKVVVSWSAVDGAESYEIYRSESPNSAGELAGTTATLSFADLPPEELRKYGYSVRAHSEGSGFGDYSSSDTGYRTIAPPEDVSATDGLFDHKVGITWTALPVSEPVIYKVYRGSDANGSGARLVGTTSGTQIGDTTADPGVIYSYFVRAILETATIYYYSTPTTQNDVASPFSPADPGHRAGEIQFRPDALIGKRPGALAGDNAYNSSGAGQQLRQVSHRGRKVICFLEIQNDGKAEPDTIRVSGPRSNPLFGISYRENSRPFGNVTAEVIRSTYLAELDPAGVRQLKVEISPSRLTRGKKKRRLLKIQASSLELRIRNDTVRAYIQTRK